MLRRHRNQNMRKGSCLYETQFKSNARETWYESLFGVRLDKKSIEK